MTKFGLVTVVITAFIAVVTAEIQAEPSAEEQKTRSLAEFHQDVQPLLRRYCMECHGEQKQEGDVRLDTLNPTAVNMFAMSHYGPAE